MTDFEEVYNLYFKDVYKYALSLSRDAAVAEEVTQETFFKALKSIDSFRGQCKLYVWLCQIAKNTYLTHTGKRQHQSYEETAESIASEADLEEALTDQESAFQIHRILHKLEEPYKEVFSLRVFGELSFKQIGELFGKTESWARVTFHRARLKIKEELQ
ncbi:MAG: RNA polymerase sigma factor [Oscillospiraceae bacterium]|nr:RNA polymerase sigma factor [Oscillospiraceae bacterium]